MGGSSKQTVGYKYYSSFLLFIGNPIEKLLNINFDKRGWIADERISYKSNGEMIYIEKPNLYGENEGGVYGTMRVKHGTNNQTVSVQYKKYMASLGLPASAYPYQSYVVFGGGGFPQGAYGLTPEELEAVGDDLETNSRWYGDGFYLGNSGYMKEMLLWPQRVHVRNDGRPQWYDEKAEIGEVGGACEYINAHLSSPHWYLNNNLTDYGFWITHKSFEESSAGRLMLRFTVTTAKSIILKNLSPILTTQGSLNISSNIEISSTHNKLDGPFWFNRHSFSLHIKPGEEQNIEIYFDYNLVVTDEYPGVAEIYVHSETPVAESGYLCAKLYGVDINPIHKIREILTDDTAMNKPESDVNDTNFIKAADRIYDEALGISWSITEKSCLDAINELCGHIEAGVRVNRQTGLYEMVLFRDDWFSDDEIHSLAVNKIKSMSLEVANADEAINQLNVSYYNRDAIKDSSFSVAENASIRNLNGRVNAEDADFPYFMNQRNAAVVAQWKLKQMSSPVWSGSFTTATYEARKWNRYDLLKLAWPRKWQGTITVRIMKINLGTGADVSIDFVEIVSYSSNLSSDIVIDEPIDIAPQPPLACPYEPFEMPYYLAVMALGQRQVDEELSYENNFGLAAVVAEKPQSNSLYALMMTHSGIEGEEWVRAATINYEPAADLDQIISRTSISFTVKDSAAIEGLPIGTLIKCGSEWVVFQGIDAYTGVVSVKRGALDSLPQAWGVNTKLYFCGNDVAFDASEYIAGEEILVSALTTTPSGMLENKGSIAIEMNARAFRPYPPANVKINGNYFPETHVISSDILLTWAHRNRVQQTGGEIIGWYEGSVTLENGVTYSLELSTVQDGVIYNASDISLDSHTIPSSVLLQNKAHKLKLWSVREGFESYQAFEHNLFVESVSLVLTATASKDKVVGSTVPVASISVKVDESLKANMEFDGSSISGKAEPGATITIEIEE